MNSTMTVTELVNFLSEAVIDGVVQVECWLPNAFIGAIEMDPYEVHFDERRDPDYGDVFSIWTNERELTLPVNVLENVFKEQDDRTGVVRFNVPLTNGGCLKLKVQAE